MTKTKTPYPIIINSGFGSRLNGFLKKGRYTSIFIICDSNTLQHCLGILIAICPSLKTAHIIELEPGEESKDLTVAQHVWQTLTESEADKKSLLINLGGGVVSDAGGFIASVYKRGIDFINIPTSLLAIADASVGGKTGINFLEVKNILGTITQPKGVFIDSVFLKTLPEEHLLSGFAEIVKIALIADKEFFNRIKEIRLDHSFANTGIIKKCVALKEKVVNKDPEENGLRKILNFGHTVGHAVESLSFHKNKPLLHGEAVAIGMAIESYISLLQKRISLQEFKSILNCLSLHFIFPRISDKENFMKFFKQDKKHKGGTYRLALLKGIGKCDFDVIVKEPQLMKAIHFYNDSIAGETEL
jgi:3-dehydroquinate synthase